MQQQFSKFFIFFFLGCDIFLFKTIIIKNNINVFLNFIYITLYCNIFYNILRTNDYTNNNKVLYI